MVVAAVVHDLDYAVANLDGCSIEGAATEVVDQPEPIFTSARQAIRYRSSHRLREKRAEHETGQLGGPDGDLALGKIEGSGNGDGGGPELFTGALKDVALQAPEHLRRELLWLHPAAGAGEGEHGISPHLQLELAGRVVLIVLEPLLGPTAHEETFALVDPDSGRCRLSPFVILHHLCSCTRPPRYYTFRDAEVYPEIDHPGHGLSS